MIAVISLVSRISRSTELRVQKATFDNAAQELLDEVLVKKAPVRFIANKIQAGDHEESLDVRLLALRLRRLGRVKLGAAY